MRWFYLLHLVAYTCIFYAVGNTRCFYGISISLSALPRKSRMKAKDDIDTVDHSIRSPFLCTVSISKYYSVSRETNGFIKFLTNIWKTVCTVISSFFFFLPFYRTKEIGSCDCYHSEKLRFIFDSTTGPMALIFMTSVYFFNHFRYSLRARSYRVFQRNYLFSFLSIDKFIFALPSPLLFFFLPLKTSPFCRDSTHIDR